MRKKTQYHPEEKITRKDALKKAGKYAAFTAAASIMILKPLKAQAGSIDDPGGGWGSGGDPSRPPDNPRSRPQR